MKSTSPLDTCNEKQLSVAEMQPAERSMYMWRKVGLTVSGQTSGL